MNHDILAVALAVALGGAVIAAVKLPRFRHCFRVPEGWAGLLYRDGLYVRRNNAGRALVWGFGWTMNLIDLRKTSQAVAGVEVLTADNVGLKLSLLVTYQVADPVKAAHETQHWRGDINNFAQLALRAVVAGATVEALLNQRLEIGAQLLARAQPELAKIGVSVLAVEVKEVTFPDDLQRALAEVLKAKPDGQARVGAAT
jgi:regulator of protease activity HflC (stomatin/prohibitin superfamily)